VPSEARPGGAAAGPGPLTEAQIRRYARHILLNEVGGSGQQRLLASSVLVVGAGGLGSPLLLYLAAAGVGRIGIIDDDRVDLTNLQRQIAHGTGDVGRPKVESARDAIAALNPDVVVTTHAQRLDAGNALDLVAAYDVVADGSDNFSTRFLLNDACYFARRPLVSGAILRFDGQVATFKAYQRGADGREHGPCYRCLFPAPPPPGDVPSCAEAGVLGAFCGVVGSLQATEVLKELLGIGEGLSGHLLLIDALAARIRRIRVPRDPACRLCGDHPSITAIAAHEQ
jgi:adenylyltransferase/sulfurtransferase